jgi:hypothetical protein
MAVFAHIARLNMHGALARRIGAVVATNTIVRNICMIKVGREPANC